MIQVIKKKEDCGFEWIDVLNPTRDELKQIAKTYNLHEPSVVNCLLPEHQPKFQEIDDSIFIILRVYDGNTKRDADTIQELSHKIAIFHTKDTIITIHRIELSLLSELEHDEKYSKKCSSEATSIYQIINNVLNSYTSPAQNFVQELDEYERDIFTRKEIPFALKSLYHLKRKIAVCKRILYLSKDIIDHLHNFNLSETQTQDLKELYIRLETMYDEAHEGATNLLNIYMSLSSQKTNEVMRVLTLFSVFFMPLSLIVGIYGMNFTNMPELHLKYGYPFILSIMAIVSISIFFWFKRKGWL